ncbi:MAG: hypothetical protein IIB60_04760 [Planctomycetes bacterium]|nr:hypothetical protein [Planctomycetota bacterium]
MSILHGQELDAKIIEIVARLRAALSPIRIVGRVLPGATPTGVGRRVKPALPDLCPAGEKPSHG